MELAKRLRVLMKPFGNRMNPTNSVHPIAREVTPHSSSGQGQGQVEDNGTQETYVTTKNISS